MPGRCPQCSRSPPRTTPTTRPGTRCCAVPGGSLHLMSFGRAPQESPTPPEIPQISLRPPLSSPQTVPLIPPNMCKPPRHPQTVPGTFPAPPNSPPPLPQLLHTRQPVIAVRGTPKQLLAPHGVTSLAWGSPPQGNPPGGPQPMWGSCAPCLGVPTPRSPQAIPGCCWEAPGVPRVSFGCWGAVVALWGLRVAGNLGCL